MYQVGGRFGVGYYESVDEDGDRLHPRSSVVSEQGTVQQKGSRLGYKVKTQAISALVLPHTPSLAEHTEGHTQMSHIF